MEIQKLSLRICYECEAERRVGPILLPVNSKRDTFYLNDSHKGYTHGCIETCGKLYDRLVQYHNRGLESIFVQVQYNVTNTNGGTRR